MLPKPPKTSKLAATAQVRAALTPKPVFTKDFLCRQMLEIVDLARNSGQLSLAMASLESIAELQGYLDDPE